MAISCSPVDLLAEAKCFMCMDESMAQAVSGYLMCQFANSGFTPAGGAGILGEGSGELILDEGGQRILPE